MSVIESNVVESISLYFKAGSSDKVYNASIEEIGGKYVVNFEYGRRGSALKSGSKTSSPVLLEDAKLVFQKLVNEKTKKGYQELKDSVDKQILVSDLPETKVVESKCVLLNPISEDEANKYCEDSDWIAQEKMDGVRFMLRKTDDKITSYNRRGVYANIPVEIYNLAKKLDSNFFLDGELVGDTMYVFDILELDGKDYRDTMFSVRFKHLTDFVLNLPQQNCIVLTKTENKNKKQFLEELQTNNKEGIVFKNKNSFYNIGRPASGGNYLKYKFYSTCSCVVKEINGNKRSVFLQLFKNKKVVDAGKVTIPVNFDIPEAGRVVEVRYLYAHKQSGSLYQPVYLGEREDIVPSECQQSQLKYKSEDD